MVSNPGVVGPEPRVPVLMKNFWGTHVNIGLNLYDKDLNLGLGVIIVSLNVGEDMAEQKIWAGEFSGRKSKEISVCRVTFCQETPTPKLPRPFSKSAASTQQVEGPAVRKDKWQINRDKRGETGTAKNVPPNHLVHPHLP
jgi:hypothetical protein